MDETQLLYEGKPVVLVPGLLPYMQLPEVGPLEEFYITMPELPAHEAVLQHASSTAKPRKDPLWVSVCVSTGGALLAILGLILVFLGAPR